MTAPEFSSSVSVDRAQNDREKRRLRTLNRYNVLDAPPTEEFNRVTRLATRLFDVSIALINFIDQENQWCLSSCGMNLDRTSREVSFCVHTLDHEGVMVVEDTHEDERFVDNPFVTEAPHVRFYAGASLTAPNGERLGTLCLLHDEPRSFSTEERETLSDLAGVVMDELNLRHYASDYRDISEQHERILESITDAFLAVDEDWTLTYVNAQAEAVLERTRAELVGHSLWDTLPGAPGSVFQSKFQTAMDEHDTVEFVEHYEPLNRWFEVKAFPFEGGLSIYFDDVTERLEAKERLRRERDLVEAIMDTSVAALLTVERNGTISFANDPAVDILGQGDPEAFPDSIHEQTLKTLDGTVVPQDEWPFERILAEDVSITDERYRLERAEGPPRYVAINAAPLHDANGTIRQVVFSIDDITDQVQYERELKAAKEEAERANQLKSAFLANMSHDVQTPLSSIMNHADLLRREVDEEHRERVDLIKRSSNRLLETLESVLDLSKLEAGAVEPTPESLDLADELLGTAEMFQPQATGDDITLETEVEDPLPAELDPTMLHRILDNLLSNALKFTESGDTVTLRGHRNDEGEIVIEVSDTGIGIDDAFLPNLFTAFARADEQKNTKGTGLGLAITKRLVDVMNGCIDVESQKSVGTTFTVQLPQD